MSRSPMRVAVVSGGRVGARSGVARNLAQFIAGLRRAGHQVLSVGDDGQQPDGDAGAALAVRQVRDCRAAFASWRAQAVHIELAGPLGHAGMEAAAAERLPISTYWHPIHEAVPGADRERALDALIGFHRRASVTFVDAAADADLLRGYGVPGVVLAGRGVDTRLFAPDARSDVLRRAWGAEDHDVVLLHVGRLLALKNPLLLARAADGARAAAPRSRLVIVGDGPERDALRARLPWAVFTGALGDDTLAEVYASCDAFLFPSLADGFGNVVVEAMASGLATVAFDRGAAARHIVDGANGRRIAVTDDQGFIDAVIALAGDSAAARALGAAARASAGAFSLETSSALVERELLALAPAQSR